MPKENTSVAIRLKSYISEFKNTFTTYSKIIFCTIFNIKIVSDKRFSVTQHVATEKHRKRITSTENKQKSQQLISQVSSSKSSFNNEPCLVLTYRLIN